MSSSEKIWQELLTTAILGTGRREPGRVTAGQEALERFLGELPAGPAEKYLLEASLAVGLFRQAGQLPAKVDAKGWADCQSDFQERCSPAAAARLAGMLQGSRPELIPEWLSLAGDANKRVAEELLPNLLDWGLRHLNQLDALLPVLGKRGQWLAELSPWKETIGAAAEAESLTSAAAEQAWVLEHQALQLGRLRQRDPALARRLVQSTWSEDGAEERAAFLVIFRTGLSMADEPFLEAALDERARSVRAAAANLLAGLPESRLVQRHLERAQAILHFKPGGLLRKAQIEVALPEECNDSMARDGILPKPLLTIGLGPKAEWAYQILSAIPPVTWSRAWGKQPAELLKLAADGEWKELLHRSWITAASRHADQEWIEAILELYPQRAHLLEGLAPERQMAYLCGQILQRRAQALEVVEVFKGAWSKELTRLVLPYLREYYLKNDDQAYFMHVRSNFLLLVRQMHTSLVEEAARVLLREKEPLLWESAVNELLQTLEFRQKMMEELS